MGPDAVAEVDPLADDALGLDGITDLPAVRWRQQNLDTISAEARAALVAWLEEVLGQ